MGAEGCKLRTCIPRAIHDDGGDTMVILQQAEDKKGPSATVPLYLAPPRLAARETSAAQAGFSMLRRRDLMNTNLGDILGPGSGRWHTGLRLCSDDIPTRPGRCAWLAVVVLPGTGESGQRRGCRGPGFCRANTTRGSRGEYWPKFRLIGDGTSAYGTTDVGDSAASRNERDLVRRRFSLISLSLSTILREQRSPALAASAVRCLPSRC